MELNQLHFAYPLWLWAGMAIPIVWGLYFYFFQIKQPFHQLEKFIDSHLLPYLLINKGLQNKAFWRYVLLWSFLWTLLTLSLAGPRMNFREIETFSKDQSLIIVLDLSESMNASDIKPSRLIRAKQKIEDLLNQSKGYKVGLIAFAADPHMIAPLTDDIEMIRYLLPSLDTDLVYLQGSRLTPTLTMASSMLEAEPGNNKSVVIISDGSFEDAKAFTIAKNMAEKGITIHTIGIGTLEGSPIKDREGNIIKKNNVPVLSKLDKERFEELSKIGNGHYLDIYDDEKIILKDLEKYAEAQKAIGKKRYIWEEHFYWLILPVLPVMLWWFRREAIFAVIFLFIPMSNLHANFQEYFKNSEELGKEAFESENFEAASNLFQDPYQKGVSYYKAGQYAEAEKSFRQSNRPEVACQAAYNIGNSLVQQQKLKEAIEAYEKVLKIWPDHTKAKENLELAKKMLEQQKEEQKKDEQNQQANNKNEDNQDQDQKGDQPSKDQENQKNGSKPDGKEDRQNSDENKESDSKKEEKKPESDPQEKKSPSKDTAPSEPKEKPEQQSANSKETRSQQDQDADLWLNRIENDPKEFMKNKFYVESKNNGATEGTDPW